MAFDPLPFLYRALREEYGVSVKCLTGNAAALKQRLYLAKKASTDPKIKSLKLSASRDDPQGAVWIVKDGGRQASD